jgi:hypothetical protein
MTDINAADGRTHHEECWRGYGHHDCAVARIEQLAKLYDESKKLAESRLDMYRALQIELRFAMNQSLKRELEAKRAWETVKEMRALMNEAAKP